MQNELLFRITKVRVYLNLCQVSKLGCTRNNKLTTLIYNHTVKKFI